MLSTSDNINYECCVYCRPYTLKQYRNIKPKEYVEIPNLKPGMNFNNFVCVSVYKVYIYILIDLNREELKAKRANLDRMKEFSKNLNNVNKTVISEQRKLPPSKEARDIKVNQEAQCSSRLRALEFSRNIPKPRVVKKESAGEARSKKQNQYNEMEMEMEDDDYYVTADDIYGADYATNSKMQALDNKHNDTKKQVDAIKKSLGLMK